MAGSRSRRTRSGRWQEEALSLALSGDHHYGVSPFDFLDEPSIGVDPAAYYLESPLISHRARHQRERETFW